jgi:chaperonin cofactor prefoldin
VNLFTRLQHPKEEYEKALSTCKEREQRISTKIEEFMKQRLREEQKHRIKTKGSQM